MESGSEHEDAVDAAPIAQVMRSLRPAAPGPAALERRLAVASILGAAGTRATPLRLGRLELQSRIGGGAMGVVYRAHDVELQRPVAIKLLRGWAGEGERLRITQEARQLAQLSHPNVVAVYDIIEDTDGLYFSMEYVAGVTLAAWLRAHPEADFRSVLAWFVQAGQGLAAAHAAGIVHRDFKPDNVLVGQDGRVRVVDFGLAREQSEASHAVGAGTPHYMAPELIAGGGADAASDQYSFCRALADALHDRQVPDALNALDALVRRGLRAAPGDRHPGMSALVEQLRACLDTGVDRRPRALLLERVETLWLQGVLARSLGRGSAVQLPLRAAPELVRPPWSSWSNPSNTPDTAQPPAEPTRSDRPDSLRRRLDEGHGSLLLVGPPGAGKTTLMLQLCRELWRAASLSPDAPAPAVLSLSTYRPPHRGDAAHFAAHFAGWIVDELVTKYGLPRPAVRRWFDAGSLVLLLDGLDETDASARGQIVETLNAFRREHGLPMVVSCRDSEYDALGARLAFGQAVAVQPLDDDAMTTLLEERHAVALLQRLERDPQAREVLRNPLLLSLHASAEPAPRSGSHAATPTAADATPQLPEWRTALHRHVEDAWSRVSRSERARLEPALVWLARAMRRHNTSDLWLERLHFSWLDSPTARRLGYAMGVLAVCLFGIGLNLAQVPLTGYPLGSALVFGGGVSLCSFAYTRGRITPVERLRWSGRRALRVLPITLLCAMVIGLIEAAKINFVSNLVGAGITGAILAPLLALEPGEGATQVRANAGIRRSLSNALGLSFAAGVPVALLFRYLLQPHILHPLADAPEYGRDGALIVGTAVGLFVFTAMFLIYGGFSVLMHYVLRVCIALTTPLPLRLPAALDRAAELGLLRRVGGGYVFLHRTLLDHFADPLPSTKQPPT